VADLTAVAERVWYGHDRGSAVARIALAPLAGLYGAVVSARGMLFDRDVLHTQALALPTISVGNVTVGGTGKTPVASWIAGRLAAAGARPAIVLRGYGDDEPLVHARLLPSAAIITDADRARGVAQAAVRGCDVAVLDDAFQHRRARRDIDLALISAERSHGPARLLPAGPYREPLTALRRASAIVVTRKAASDEVLAAACVRASNAASGVPVVAVSLRLDEMRAWHEENPAQPIRAIAGERVLAVAAVGDPGSFFAQLRAAGATVEEIAFRDHHAFTGADVSRIVTRATGCARVVCTLKDAVKVGPLWPRLASPLWYVSQRVTVDRGGDVLDHLLARLLAARALPFEPTGSGRLP
jgi:tetraacyldisaccharide 4'-kinase